MKILLKTACGCYKLQDVSGLVGMYYVMAIPVTPRPITFVPTTTEDLFLDSFRQRKFEYRGQIHNYNGERVQEFQEVVE
jgi:hypothetical protein